MCTRARLVQAGSASEWFGMTHGEGTRPDILLQEGEPAILEIAVDPAAHGEAGLGPIQRMIWLGTSAGQQLQFDVTARVVP
jgi:hypothetical protein